MCRRACIYKNTAMTGGLISRSCDYCLWPGNTTRTTAISRKLGLPPEDPAVREALDGENCPLFETGKKKRKSRMELVPPEPYIATSGRGMPEKPGHQYVPPADPEKLMELYEQNLTDREIGEKLNISQFRVKNWRQHNNLPGYRRCREKTRPRVEDTVLQELYDQGLRDVEIARATGLLDYEVGAWRKKAGLPANSNRRKFDRKLARELYDQGWSDKKIAKELGVNHKTVASWRYKNGLQTKYGTMPAKEG